MPVIKIADYLKKKQYHALKEALEFLMDRPPYSPGELEALLVECLRVFGETGEPLPAAVVLAAFWIAEDLHSRGFSEADALKDAQATLANWKIFSDRDAQESGIAGSITELALFLARDKSAYDVVVRLVGENTDLLMSALDLLE